MLEGPERSRGGVATALALQPEHLSRPRHRASPRVYFYVTVVTSVGRWLSGAPDFIQSDRLPGSTPSALCVLLIPHSCPVTRLLSSPVQRGRSKRFNDLPGATQLTSGFCPTPRPPDSRLDGTSESPPQVQSLISCCPLKHRWAQTCARNGALLVWHSSMGMSFRCRGLVKQHGPGSVSAAALG